VGDLEQVLLTPVRDAQAGRCAEQVLAGQPARPINIWGVTYRGSGFLRFAWLHFISPGNQVP